MISRELITDWITTDLPNAVQCLTETWAEGDSVGVKDAITEIRMVVQVAEDQLKDDLYRNLRR